jgi:hypothetical protein
MPKPWQAFPVCKSTETGQSQVYSGHATLFGIVSLKQGYIGLVGDGGVPLASYSFDGQPGHVFSLKTHDIHPTAASKPYISQIGNPKLAFAAVLFLMPQRQELPAGNTRVGKAIESVTAFESWISGLFPVFNPAKKRFVGPVHTPHGLLQGMRAERDVLRALFFEIWQSVLLLIVRNRTPFFLPSFFPLSQGIVVQPPVQLQPVGQDSFLSLGWVKSYRAVSCCLLHKPMIYSFTWKVNT